MDNQQHFDDVLIKLQRQYSKDETVAALSKILKRTRTENGELKAEVDHLKFELNKKKQELTSDIKKEFDKKISVKNKKISQLKKDIADLIYKYHNKK